MSQKDNAIYKSDLLQYISGSISDTDLLEQLTELGLEVDQSKKKNDLLIKLDLTPNRGDCFSLIGIARDVCAVNNLKLKLPKFKKQQQSLDSKKTVSLDKSACSSYLGQIIKLKSKGKTPQHIKKTLKAADIGQVNPIVDITNYVMLHPDNLYMLLIIKRLVKKFMSNFLLEKQN